MTYRIQHLINNPWFFPKVRKLLETREVLAVECVFGELLQGAKTARERDIILGFWKYFPKEHYEDIAIEAGIYSVANKLCDKGVGLIDAIILMHGIKSGSKIWTLDTQLLRVLPEGLNYYG